MKKGLLKLICGAILATTVIASGLVMGPKEVKADSNRTIRVFIKPDGVAIVFKDNSGYLTIADGDVIPAGTYEVKNDTPNIKAKIIVDGSVTTTVTPNTTDNITIADDTYLYSGSGIVLTFELEDTIPSGDKVALTKENGNAFGYSMADNTGEMHYNTQWSHDRVNNLVGGENVCLHYGPEVYTEINGDKYVYKNASNNVPALSYETKGGSTGNIQYKYDSRADLVWFATPSLTTGKSWKLVSSAGTLKLLECDEETVSPSNYKRVEEKKEKKKEEEKKESSSSESAPAPALTPAQQAKITEQAQAVVGSTAYAEKQAEVQKSVAATVASIATLTPVQKAAATKSGVPVALGGCTTLDRTTVATIASNNTIPYNMGFTWNGINFIVKVPAGANYLSLIDASGNLPMWKLVQKYGIAGATLAK